MPKSQLKRYLVGEAYVICTYIQQYISAKYAVLIKLGNVAGVENWDIEAGVVVGSFYFAVFILSQSYEFLIEVSTSVAIPQLISGSFEQLRPTLLSDSMCGCASFIIDAVLEL
jgi:hypothetical protein